MARKAKQANSKKTEEAPKPTRQRIKVLKASGKIRLEWRDV